MKRLLLIVAVLLSTARLHAQDYSAPEILNMGEVLDKIGYPMEAKNAHVGGKVIANVKVDEKGKVASAEIIESPSPVLADAVKAHIEALRFKPAKKGGQAVASVVKVPFLFELPESTHFSDLNKALASLGEVESLDLSNQGLKAIDTRIQQLSSLRSLNLAGNQITTLPGHVAKLRVLEQLDLSGNPITAYPKSLKKLKNLKRLTLSGTSIPKEQVAKIRALYKDAEVIAD